MAKGMEQNTIMHGDTIGEVRIARDVVANIAGIAATEVEGVAATVGNISNEVMNKVGIKTLSKAIRVEMDETSCKVAIGLIMKYGYHIPSTCKKVQERVTMSIENMTGLKVADVNIRVAGVDMVGQA